MRRMVMFCTLSALLTPAFGQDGTALFKAKCTLCHSQSKVLDGVRKIAEAERPEHLEKFLAGHHVPDAAQREAIVGYLLEAAR